MRRYVGEELPAGSRIAVLANDALGNFVVATPLLQLLRKQLKPSQIDYYGGRRTWELQSASDLFDWTFPLHGSDESEAIAAIEKRKPYDLVINVERNPFAVSMARLMCSVETQVAGPIPDLPFSDDDRGRLWQDQEWVSEDICKRYPFLGSSFIGEIYSRLCYLNDPLPPYRVPSADPGAVPDVLISTAASMGDKLWPSIKWSEVLRWVKARGLSVGLLGAPPNAQRQHWEGEDLESELVALGLVDDLRGKFTLPQVAGALAKAKAVFTIDNGILHLAAAGGAPTVGLFRHGIHRLWAPPVPNLKVLTPGEGKPVAEITVDCAIRAVECAF